MDWKSHLAIGVIAGAITSYFFFQSQALLFCSICALSSLLPDLDIKNSKASKMLYAALLAALLLLCCIAFWGSWLLLAGSFIVCAAVLCLLAALIRPRHRGVVHGVLFALVLSAACLLLLGTMPAAAVFIGYFSHLLADGCVKL